MWSFKFLGGFLLRKKSEKCIAFSRPELALQTRAIWGFAIAPAASLAPLAPAEYSFPP